MAFSPLPEINPDDATSVVFGKINSAIRGVNSLQQQLLDVAAQSRRELVSVRDQLHADDVLDRAIFDTYVEKETARLYQFLFSTGSPGYSPASYSRSTVGLTADALGEADTILTALGPVCQISGAGIIAPRKLTLLSADDAFVLQARYWRLTDVLDPNNNAVDIGIQWLDSFNADAGRLTIKREVDLQVQDGPHSITIRVPSMVGDTPAIAPPKTAVSWRPYLKTYGSDGATAVQILDVRDVTFSGFYVPDVYALSGRLSTIEGQIQQGLPLTAPIQRGYAVADLPKPGNPGREAFARDGRAPNAAGVLEAANAGTGVTVVDNGTNWVIIGTNQKVQS